MTKTKIPYEEARLKFKKFPLVNPKKTVQQKQEESIPLERRERYLLGLGHQNKTADRLLIFDRPANRGAKRVTAPRSKEKKPERSVAVYLIRFRSIMDPCLTFLKIGITNDQKNRFGFDVHRYNMETIKNVRNLTRKEALKIEGRLHRMFVEKSHTPKMKLLSGGNSECFEDDEEIISMTCKLFEIIKNDLADIVQR